MTRHTVIYGEQTIDFVLERKNVKNLNLNVRPDLSISVSANEDVPLEVIKEFVKDKGSWISKKLEYFQRFQPDKKSEKEYVSGESFKYLGKQYRLRVRESDVETVKYFRGYIYLYVRDPSDFKKKERLIETWFQQKAEYHFNQSLERMHKLVHHYGIPKPEVRIREMKARWGSCYRDDGVIILNSELIKAPKHCIDYVVLHELIHFVFKDHDHAFYTFLTSLMPDWESRKQILDEEVVRDL